MDLEDTGFKKTCHCCLNSDNLRIYFCIDLLIVFLYVLDSIVDPCWSIFYLFHKQSYNTCSSIDLTLICDKFLIDLLNPKLY